MEPFKENGTVNLRAAVKRQPPTRIIGKTTNLHANEGFSALPFSRGNVSQKIDYKSVREGTHSVNLTNNNFSVTRARVHAHAYAHAHVNNYVRSNNDLGGLKRVLDAALSGGDVKVASIKPMSFATRFIAFLLLPTMLVMPLLPAYANEAPLPERIAGDVAEIVAADNLSLATVITAIVNTESIPADVNNSNPENILASLDASTTQPVILSQENSSSTSETVSSEIAGTSSVNIKTDEGEVLASASTSNSSSNSVGDTSSKSDSNQNDLIENNNSTSSSNIISDNSTSSEKIIFENIITKTTDPQVEIKDDSSNASIEEKVEDVQVLDIPSSEVQEDLDSIRARLRKELREEVKMEVKGEIEKEVYRGCKNLDGLGYYCIPDAKSFGPAVVANERSISVVVQQDEIEGDKEIFLSRNNVALQLTHNTDDDVFPVLDPASDLLVWQSLRGGHWQIAYAHVSDVGVPKVNYLTQGENNFNPKVYRGRIVWQAWVEGNWEIFSASKAHEKLSEEALTAEHRLAHVDGNWNVKRITANNTPDMFPSVTGDAITWQAIDEGVWQVFSYDLVTNESRRISKKGVKSESPRTALVWNEEDATGQLKLVGSDLNNTEAIDFTELARRLVDKSKDSPKSPIANTDLVVITPTIVRVEEEVAITN